MTKKPLILVTNDDGITAPGIRHLIQVMREFGEVVVVAPDSPQSGMGHAVTLHQPLRLDEVDLYPGIKAYQCTGTPVDCVKLAVDVVLDRKPDLLVSGINHGSNSSINVIYSGTMSAAVEGAIEGISSIGFSLLDYSYKANFVPLLPYVKQIAKEVLEKQLPHGTLLNVNFPKVSATEEIKGVKVCRQALAKWKENFVERTDPNGRQYYWMTGRFVNDDKGEDTDEWALEHGYVSVVPVQFDLTDHHQIPFINRWNFNVQ
ncbi:MAG: 5'/3'-nucleotidase SurE [Bacteroidota bacterium]|nr:5'/3'-nucleotidase SurE [Bacteroidota bacterium]MDX5429457.1 5'/3'-nucleotidase SurE [Bacteroidota bacterium]MDX5468249.1 5'/3'-nucleotidase SurE [Bacteroidota bacterium]